MAVLWRTGIKLAVIVLAPLAVLAGVLTTAGPYTIGDVDLASLNRPASYTFITPSGRVVGRSGAITGDRLMLTQMPSYLPAAFIAAEDRHFYFHGSADILSIARAALRNLHAGKVVEGGSSITQQTAKLLFLTPDRTLGRKFRELAGALALERRFSKDEILSLYLNRLYLGSNAYGVDAAARLYFGKSARDLTLSEAAMLAGVTPAPSVYSPRRNLALAQRRASLVLDAMVETRAITPEMAAFARSHPADIVPAHDAQQSGFFFDTATAEAKRLARSPQGDLIIVTTYDPALQDAARAAVDTTLAEQGGELDASEAAVVLMETDGAVRAIVGGRNYAEGQYNRATQARRQPGSAFKPFVYLAALETGYRPSDTVNDRPINIRGYRPHNFGGGHAGRVTLISALARSINTISVRLLDSVGAHTVVETAHRLGIASALKANPSLALGTSEVTPMELTRAFGAFASGGYLLTPYTILEVRTPAGTPIYRHALPLREPIIAPRTAERMDRMLRAVVARGTGRAAKLAFHQAAGKTGTSSNFHDAWFVGYAENMVAGVWVGNDDNRPMQGVTGGSLPARIWRQVMSAALEDQPRAYAEARRVRVAEDRRAAPSRTLEPCDAAAGVAVFRGGHMRERAMTAALNRAAFDNAAPARAALAGCRGSMAGIAATN